jgi:hypothetical protein
MKESNKGIYRTYSELATQFPSESTKEGGGAGEVAAVNSWILE